MLYRTHLVGGVALGLTANYFITHHSHFFSHSSISSPILSTFFIAGSVLGALLPDIDHRNSYIGKRLPLLSFVTNKTLGHRGATHAPLITFFINAFFIWLITFFLNGASNIISLSFIAGVEIGALSHILLDALTKSGVPLLYPFSKKQFSLAPIRTGSLIEHLFMLLLIVYIVWFSIQIVD